MPNARNDIIAAIRACLPFAADPACEVREESVLAELGVNSLHLITLLLTLQQDYAFDIDRITQLGLTMTVGDLATVIERGVPPV
jgi:acyl carrier protein